MSRPLFAACLALLALPALLPPSAHAGTAPLALTYETFEQAVAHVDLEVCPEPLAAPDRFCRATLVNGMINVFAFSEEGDQVLVAVQSWDAVLLNGLMD
jgi:hypothetical protein